MRHVFPVSERAAAVLFDGLSEATAFNIVTGKSRVGLGQGCGVFTQNDLPFFR